MLSNIFAQNTSLQPFFDISLQRADNLNPLDKGILTFGAHEPGRESIAQTAVLNNVLHKRWSVFIDGMAINGRNISFNASNLATAPSGKLTAVMDTGTTKGLIPDALVDEIYSNIPGAVSAGNMWQVPCVGAMNISFFIGCVPATTRYELQSSLRLSVTTAAVSNSPYIHWISPSPSRFPAILIMSTH